MPWWIVPVAAWAGALLVWSLGRALAEGNRRWIFVLFALAALLILVALFHLGTA